MWVALWIVTMLLVHLQFRYCGAFTVGFLKIAEASLIVVSLKLYMEYDISSIIEKIPQYNFIKPTS
jgi:hypothetical protein